MIKSSFFFVLFVPFSERSERVVNISLNKAFILTTRSRCSLKNTKDTKALF